MDSLRIVSFRDAPGRELDPILNAVGPRLRSLRLMNNSARTRKVLERCPNLEEFVLVQLSTLFGLSEGLPGTLEHLSCRNLPDEPQSLESVIGAVEVLPRLRVVTCDKRARLDERFGELETLCAGKGIELFVDETPFWVRDDPVRVDRFPKRKSVANFALMN
uniref:Chromosome partition protein Smc n=1 Tax=Ganoderma boninense TaxID=34458 RepID=A0A5K1K467_9APHY|nr:Chromosome partition protein Smc [Ganoderma boninense]